MKRPPDLTILVPVFNEIATIGTVLNKTVNLPINNYEVIVVDDFSADGSREFISDWIKKLLPDSHKSQIRLISHDKNYGKGRAIQTALKNAQGTYFVVQDADLEYDPAEIPALLEFAKRKKASAVYGSRFMGKIAGMPAANYLANRSYNLLVRLMYRKKITDMHTCYKMVETQLLKDIGITANGFDYAVELISKLLKQKIKIYERPISFKGRSIKQGKKIDWKDGLRCYYLLFKYRLSL